MKLRVQRFYWIRQRDKHTSIVSLSVYQNSEQNNIMKQVVAYIRPNKLAAVTLALQKIQDLPGMSFSEVRGFGRDRMPQNDPHLVRDLVDYTPYVRVEVFCPAELAYEVRCSIEQAAHTGAAGDGKLYQMEVTSASCIQEADGVAVAV
jgi:nitrogen regulatory protein PII